ncbi:MAG: aspartate aminotransferase family protein [archaeon]|nr:aspartate aminotransferase family protein [archaeon]
MDFETVKENSDTYLFQNYGRAEIAFDHGEGSYLYDLEGNKYLDAVSGIAVCSLGYSHPEWVKVMRDQIAHLVHVSNLYYVKEQAQLAQKLSLITPDSITRSIFVNSGAEANEAALKTAVKYTGREKVVSAFNGFHGRTSASLGATGQAKYQDPFRPLISNAYQYYTYNDLESVKDLVTRNTAAVMLECIQGEGGVNCATPEFIRGVRDICSDSGALMIVDEVQTGMGRTGRYWSFDHFGVVPDMITSAKGLAAGMPIGALLTTDEIAKCMTPGTHGSTFGGNPMVCASACAVIDILAREKILDNVVDVSESWMADLKAIKSDKIVDVRGKGFLIGVEMDSNETAAAVKEAMFKENILVNVCHGKVVRIIPPLIFTMEQKNVFMKAFCAAVQ